MERPREQKRPSPDWRTIEVPSWERVEELRAMTGTERVEAGFRLWNALRRVIECRLLADNPDWTDEMRQEEIARTMRDMASDE